jgi:hypothetical protein
MFDKHTLPYGWEVKDEQKYLVFVEQRFGTHICREHLDELYEYSLRNSWKILTGSTTEVVLRKVD